MIKNFTLQIELNLAVLRLAEEKKNIRGEKMSPAKYNLGATMEDFKMLE